MCRRLVLASASPRRRELLSILGARFEVIPPRADQRPRPEERPVDYVARAARDKGYEVSGRVADAIVLSADTIVSVDDRILGKPADQAEGIRMLELLSGREHSVYTAVSVIDSSTGRGFHGLDRTRVWFRSLSRRAIEDYVNREDVLDKAGAYAIQGFAAVFIPRIEGSYGTVVGLPLPLACDLLARHGVECVTSS